MKIVPIEKQNIVQLICKHKNDTILSALSGECKKAVESRRKFATLAVNNFDVAKDIEQPYIGGVSLFSKMGFNLIKFWLYSKFVKTTPDEKKLKMLYDLDKQGKLDIYQ